MNGKIVVYAALCAFLAISGWLAGSRQTVEAQSPGDTVVYAGSGEWRMFSQNVSSGDFSNDGVVWIYNSGTGATYRVWTGCGEDFPDGCMVKVPVAVDTSSSSFLPSMESRLDRGSIH